MITENSRLTFGKHKGTPLKYCPLAYLKWLADNLADGDFHDWATLASQLHQTLSAEGAAAGSLEKQADDFLRAHGINPKQL